MLYRKLSKLPILVMKFDKGVSDAEAEFSSILPNWAKLKSVEKLIYFGSTDELNCLRSQTALFLGSPYYVNEDDLRRPALQIPKGGIMLSPRKIVRQGQK
jgi:hypothetical protein